MISNSVGPVTETDISTAKAFSGTLAGLDLIVCSKDTRIQPRRPPEYPEDGQEGGR